MIKLIACDLDGTILTKEKKIDSNLKEVIQKLKNKGIEFTFVSGRNEEIMWNFVDELEVKNPYVTNNGGNIYHNHKCLINNFIEQKYNNEILKLFYDHDYAFRAFATEGIIGNSITPFFEERMHIFDKQLQKYDPNIDYSNFHFYKITMDYRNDKDSIDEVKKKVNSLDNTVMLQAEVDVCCVNHSSANKGNGLRQICNLMNIDLSEVMAFGDNFNDVPMLEITGVSVVPKNADKQIQEKVDYVCDNDNNNHAVSDFLEKYFKL